MPRFLVAILFTAIALAGCSTHGPDAILPGVRTESTVTDSFRCGELLFTAGCVIVHVGRVESGCSPEVPGYMVCNGTMEWMAETGAVAPQTRLTVSVNGTETGDSCVPTPGAKCFLEGAANFTHHFGGPGEEYAWSVAIAAQADVPGDAGPVTGEFTLRIDMVVRTEEASATDV